MFTYFTYPLFSDIVKFELMIIKIIWFRHVLEQRILLLLWRNAFSFFINFDFEVIHILKKLVWMIQLNKLSKTSTRIRREVNTVSLPDITTKFLRIWFTSKSKLMKKEKALRHRSKRIRCSSTWRNQMILIIISSNLTISENRG
jgi:hypothetical protein